jgi:hypothetical protein
MQIDSREGEGQSRNLQLEARSCRHASQTREAADIYVSILCLRYLKICSFIKNLGTSIMVMVGRPYYPSAIYYHF